jgi:CubicO group peptidase (beta-lactamase class C family)
MTQHSESRHFPTGSHEVFIDDGTHRDISKLKQIAPLIHHSIESGYYPGAVVLAAQDHKVIYRGAFGSQSVIPVQTPMSIDTIFDTASLTKVVVTTTAIMQLVEQGNINLDAPVAEYWPEFGAHDKSTITISDMLTHTSGLPATIPSRLLNEILADDLKVPDLLEWEGKESALEKIIAMKPTTVRGTGFRYSDVNFIVLAYIVERVSGLNFDVYAHQHIFSPLGMSHSYLSPPRELLDTIAPTEIISGVLHWGEAHDPTAYLMNCATGSAGLFSTTNDLGKFAQMILNKGRISSTATTPSASCFLKPETVAAMTSIQTSCLIPEKRGLGWDISSPLSCRGKFSDASFGHTGWTGTSMWIDPANHIWLIILTSRTHPTPHIDNKLVSDRIEIATLMAESVLSELPA